MRFSKEKMLSTMNEDEQKRAVTLSWVHEYDGRRVTPLNRDWYVFAPSMQLMDHETCKYLRVHRTWLIE